MTQPRETPAATIETAVVLPATIGAWSNLNTQPQRAESAASVFPTHSIQRPSNEVTSTEVDLKTAQARAKELLARAALARRLEVQPSALGDFGFEVSSAGVAAHYDAPISRHAADVLEELGPELGREARAHRAAPAIPEDLLEADRVYALTQAHLDVLVRLLPPGRGRHATLLDPDGGDVPDPIGSSLGEYRRCRDHLARLIELRLESWA